MTRCTSETEPGPRLTSYLGLMGALAPGSGGALAPALRPPQPPLLSGGEQGRTSLRALLPLFEATCFYSLRQSGAAPHCFLLNNLEGLEIAGKNTAKLLFFALSKSFPLNCHHAFRFPAFDPCVSLT